MTRGQLPKAYLRLDPNIDRAKADTRWDFIRLLCEANRQPRRGVFKTRALFDATLGRAAARKLLAAGDARELDSGEVMVPGWEEWQEGDVTVAERQRRIRARRVAGEKGPRSGAERTAAWRLRNTVFERDHYTCRYCGAADYEREWLVLEHVNPHGPSDETNLVTACRPCNKLKGERTPEEAGMPLRPVTEGDSDASPSVTVTRHDRIPTPISTRYIGSPIGVGHKAARQQGSKAPDYGSGGQAGKPAGDHLPDETDSATLACRHLPDGGRWLDDREYVAAWDDMDRRYGVEWVQSVLTEAYAACLERRGKVRAWDLKRMVEQMCAERSRAEELARQRAAAAAAAAESEALRRKADNATPEERERAAIVRRAVGLWTRSRQPGPIPTDFDELRRWLESQPQGAAS